MKLRPVLDGEWWLIGPSPDLVGLLPGAEEHRAAWDARGRTGEHNAPVDHHVFQGPDGKWHLWGCVRSTAVGRILYHWEADSLTDSPWLCTGKMVRCDREAGECLNDRKSEQIQSPYFVEEDGRFYMFYGGTSAGIPDGNGNLIDEVDMKDMTTHIASNQCQICLMTSDDGHNWTRHRDENGFSRLFVGPGTDRDPCLIKIDGLWHMYYIGYEGDGRTNNGFVCRTSQDLIHWSDWTLVHRDDRFGGSHHWRCECPHVVHRDGYFYLFRTEEYYSHRTHVFRSEDPLNFGVGDAMDKYVGYIPAAAVEIYEIDGQEYISSNHNPPRGTEMCKLRWIED